MSRSLLPNLVKKELAKFVLIESPTGTGKTQILIDAALAAQLELRKDDDQGAAITQIIYLTRTHAQVDQVMEACGRSMYFPLAIPLRSRERVCPLYKRPEMQSLYKKRLDHQQLSTDVHSQLCKYSQQMVDRRMRQQKERNGNQTLKSAFTSFEDIEELGELASRMNDLTLSSSGEIIFSHSAQVDKKQVKPCSMYSSLYSNSGVRAIRQHLIQRKHLPTANVIARTGLRKQPRYAISRQPSNPNQIKPTLPSEENQAAPPLFLKEAPDENADNDIKTTVFVKQSKIEEELGYNFEAEQPGSPSFFSNGGGDSEVVSFIERVVQRHLAQLAEQENNPADDSDTDDGSVKFKKRRPKPLKGITSDEFMTFSSAPVGVSLENLQAEASVSLGDPKSWVEVIRNEVDWSMQLAQPMCPYYLSMGMMSLANIIVSPYNYVIQETICKTMDIPLDDSILIVDEAHNFEHVCRDAGSGTLSINDLTKLIDQLGGIHTHLQTLKLSRSLPADVDTVELPLSSLPGGPVRDVDTVTAVSYLIVWLLRFRARLLLSGRAYAQRNPKDPLSLRLDRTGNMRYGDSATVPRSVFLSPVQVNGALQRSALYDYLGLDSDIEGVFLPLNIHVKSVQSGGRRGAPSEPQFQLVNPAAFTQSGGEFNFNPHSGDLQHFLRACLSKLDKEQPMNFAQTLSVQSRTAFQFDEAMSAYSLQNWTSPGSIRKWLDMYEAVKGTLSGTSSIAEEVPFDDGGIIDTLSAFAVSLEHSWAYSLELTVSNASAADCLHDTDGLSFESGNPVNVSLSFHLLTAELTFNRIAKSAYAIIMASGTLSPVQGFLSELGPMARQMQHRITMCEHVIHPAQFKVYAVSSYRNSALSSKVRDQTTQMQINYLHSLLECVKVSPDKSGIIIFFTSKKNIHQVLSRNALRRINRNSNGAKQIYSTPFGIDAQSRQTIYTLQDKLAQYPIFSEEEHGKDAPRLFRLAVKRGKKAILLAVHRGTQSEGVSFNDEYCRTVICVGLPLPRYGGVVVEKIKFNDNRKSLVSQHFNANRGPHASNLTAPPWVKGVDSPDSLLSGEVWYQQQAYQAINQAVGRVIRSASDWGVAFLLDDRLYDRAMVETGNMQLDYYSQWLAPHLKPIKNVEDACRDFEEALKVMPQAGLSNDDRLRSAYESKKARRRLSSQTMISQLSQPVVADTKNIQKMEPAPLPTDLLHPFVNGRVPELRSHTNGSSQSDVKYPFLMAPPAAPLLPAEIAQGLPQIQLKLSDVQGGAGGAC